MKNLYSLKWHEQLWSFSTCNLLLYSHIKSLKKKRAECFVNMCCVHTSHHAVNLAKVIVVFMCLFAYQLCIIYHQHLSLNVPCQSKVLPTLKNQQFPLFPFLPINYMLIIIDCLVCSNRFNNQLSILYGNHTEEYYLQKSQCMVRC